MRVVRRFRLVLFLLAVAIVACQPAPLRAPATPTAVGQLQLGMNYVGWYAGAYRQNDSDRSLENLAATGTRWAAVVVTNYQQQIGSTTIDRSGTRTPTDDDVTHAIATAHRLGLKVMLKPHLDLLNDPSHWRGQIGEEFLRPSDWASWFASYDALILHEADLARDNQVEQFCIGTELVGTSTHEPEWRALVAQVRQHYPGKITYAGNHDGEEQAIRWWDALDFIGVDAYYPLTDQVHPTVAVLNQAWDRRGYVALLKALSTHFGKRVIFTEIGYRAIANAAADLSEWQNGGVPDVQTQANLYQAAIDTFGSLPWFGGFYWWAWPATARPIGGDAEWSPGGQDAERILHAFNVRAVAE